MSKKGKIERWLLEQYRAREEKLERAYYRFWKWFG